MSNVSCYLGLYAVGCVVAMVFFLTGRWPAVLERGWRWPVIFLWPLLVLWPLFRLVKWFGKTHHAHANGNQKGGG